MIQLIRSFYDRVDYNLLYRMTYNFIMIGLIIVNFIMKLFCWFPPPLFFIVLSFLFFFFPSLFPLFPPFSPLRSVCYAEQGKVMVLVSI